MIFKTVINQSSSPILKFINRCLDYLLNRKHQEKEKKKEVYATLQKNIDGFNMPTDSVDAALKDIQKRNFLRTFKDNFDIFPDIVSAAIEHFIQTVHVGNQFSNDDRQNAKLSMINAMQLDLGKKQFKTYPNYNVSNNTFSRKSCLQKEIPLYMHRK